MMSDTPDMSHSPIIDPQEWLTLSEAAKLEECDIGEEGLKKACQRKQLGEKRGGRWWIQRKKLSVYLQKRKRGRPPLGLD